MDRSYRNRSRGMGMAAALGLALASHAGAGSPGAGPGLNTLVGIASASPAREARLRAPHLAVDGAARGCGERCMCSASPAMSGYAYTYAPDTVSPRGEGLAPAAVRATRLPDPAPDPSARDEVSLLTRNL